MGRNLGKTGRKASRASSRGEAAQGWCFADGLIDRQSGERQFLGHDRVGAEADERRAVSALPHQKF
jgi:hypothetical protein